MKRSHNQHLILLCILVAGALALASCDSSEPAVPPGATGSPTPSPIATASPAPSATPPPGGPIITPGEPLASPTDTPPAVSFDPTATPPIPTTPPAASPTATPSPAVTLPTAPPGGPYGPIVGPGQTPLPTTSVAPTQETGPYGPIVGPGHTLVPTETRVPPTQVPTLPPTPGPSPTPGPGLNSALMGIQIHPHIDSREIDTIIGLIRELGVDWVKLQFNWSLLESSPGRYTELYFMLTSYVRRLHDQGFKVMISVAKAPGWARRPTADGVMHEAAPPDNPEHLANFLTALLNHLGHDGAGQPYVDAIEVWNEPNLEREWYGHPLTGEEYMRYFRPAHSAIRAFSPSIVVITAGPAPTGNSHWSTDDREWLRGLYNAGLARFGADVAVGIHPYGWANPPDARCCANPGRGWDDHPQFFFLDTIADYRAIMDLAGHGAAPLWVTEFGWATFDGLRTAGGGLPPDPAGAPYFSFINQYDQAAYTVRAFQIAQSLPYMGPMILWNLNFSTIPGALERSDPTAGYGLLDVYWQPRPVFQYLKQAPKF